MRWAWVDYGNDPAWHLLAAHSITGEFFHLYDPRLTTAYLNESRNRGHVAGLYVVDNWDPIVTMSGADAAREVDRMVKRIVPKPTPSFPKVQFDLERHDPVWIRECLTEWRSLRPKQDTSWTMEPMQGGWMDPAFVQAITGLRIRVVPQAYGGSMQRFAEDVVLRDLTARGFPESLVTLFYDAAALPLSWDGWAFTQGRLPR